MSTGIIAEGLTIKRGGLTVCRDVSLTAPLGEVTVMIGANGAGKTTLLDGISGVLPLSAGQVSLGAQRLDRLPPYRRATRGLSYVEQGRSVFGSLTTAQNIAVVDPSPEALERAFALFPRLADKQETRAGLLSGGEQQMLLISRALAMRPEVLMIDELSLGLAPKVVMSLMETLSELAASGIGVLLVEQFAELALQIGTTAYVLERGQVVRAAPCSELLEDRSAIESTYLSGGQRPDTRPDSPNAP
ncbi:MAG: ABC transporter ATP-binding protein [Leucobacter sp.]